MAGDLDYLPLDIIFRILLCLPVSSLLRFKSVCKSWLSLIQTPEFVHKHFHFASGEQHTNLLLLSRRYESHQQQLISLFSADNKTELPLEFPVIHDPYQFIPVKLVASYNGVICLQQDRRVCLWNPATKQCTNLPPLPVVSFYCSIGFGFDSKSNDYKLVCINLVSDRYVFHIYSLSSDSWRKFEGLVLPDMLITSDIKAPYRDRIFCWLAWTDGGEAVYTFDFSDEVFGDIPSPSSIYPHTLFILTENIACVGEVKSEEDGGLTRSSKNRYYEIWMLSDYEVKGPWTKLYSIDPISESIHWMTWFPKNGEFVLFLAGKQLCLCDLVTQEVMNLPVHDRDGHGFEVVTYKESMLSIRRKKGAANGVTSMIQDWNSRMLINQSMTGNNSWGDINAQKAVVFHILLWLPVESLLRFRSVCKSWCSLINSSDFVSQHILLHHHHRRDKNDRFNLILHSNSAFRPFFMDSSHHSPNTSCTCLLSADKLEPLDLPVCDSWGYGFLYIATSFNGIICLKHSHHNRHVYLWNPATKHFRDVEVEWLPSHDDSYFCFGSGFDVKTNDYKLVKLHLLPDSGIQNVVQVYNVSTDSWRTISHGVIPAVKSVHSGLNAPYRNEIYCWLADIDDTTSTHSILSFDFSNEVFGTMPLPDSIDKSSFTLELTVLRENIACISLGENCYSDTESWDCEIWMMSEFGVKESWFKLYMAGPFSKDWHFKTYYSKKNGDYILLLKDGQLYAYDLVTQEMEKLPSNEGLEDYQVVAYEESLVPVKRDIANGSCQTSFSRNSVLELYRRG